MPNESLASIAISNDIIRPILEAKIQAQIVEALGGQREMLEKAVESVLLTHRDRDGKPCSKSGYGDVGTFLEVTARKYIEGTTKAALEQFFDESKPDITKAIRAQLKKEMPALVEAFFKGVKQGATNQYHTSVSFNFTPRER